MKLEVCNGCFSYGKRKVLERINLSVEDSDVFAILGRNGVGKTTLLKCIMRMLPWESGKCTLDGVDVACMTERQFWQNVAYVPQAKYAPESTVRDAIVLGRSAHIGLFQHPCDNDYAIADSVIERLRIEKIANQHCDKLSGGELQLVMIGRALAAEPKILILDEPESNLDYHNQLHVLNLISELSRTCACILNTHYPEHALRYAAKALLLKGDGTSISGPVNDVITEDHLRNAFGTEVYIGSQRVGNEEYKYILPLHK